jgi:hypothetical protein
MLRSVDGLCGRHRLMRVRPMNKLAAIKYERCPDVHLSEQGGLFDRSVRL